MIYSFQIIWKRYSFSFYVGYSALWNDCKIPSFKWAKAIHHSQGCLKIHPRTNSKMLAKYNDVKLRRPWVCRPHNYSKDDYWSCPITQSVQRFAEMTATDQRSQQLIHPHKKLRKLIADQDGDGLSINKYPGISFS